MISQKCQYALRAVFELAKRHGQGLVKIGEIAYAQAIPLRFLEVILSQLKQAGFLTSRRGAEGGYALLRSPASLTVGEVIRSVEGPPNVVECTMGPSAEECPMRGTCVFEPMWRKVEEAIAEVYDGTTFKDLIEQEAIGNSHFVPSYAI